ncbi:MAG: dihydrolipoamide acetyltransferase [Pseudomonadales bacterium]|nr:dihydrolipoamide acetyltransferase [Pseudomonadales bacterium]
MTTEVLVPNLGDIDEVEVIEICVQAGETVAAGDTLIVIESDKASMDVPAETAGTVVSIAVSLGDMVSEGSLITVLEDSEDEPEKSVNDAPPAKESKAPTEPETVDLGATPQEAAKQESSVAQSSVFEVLVPDIGDATGVVVIEVAIAVGQQVEENDLLVVLESDKASMEISAETGGEILEVCVAQDDEVEQGSLIAKIVSEAAQEDASDVTSDSPTKIISDQNDQSSAPSVTQSAQKPVEVPATNSAKPSTPVYAGPATRRLARELGVDLTGVQGSGQRNRILKDDVKAFVKEQLLAKDGLANTSSLPALPVIDFARFGPIHDQPLSRIRRRGALNLHASWVNLPHVTQHDEVDISDLEDFRNSLKPQAEAHGVRLTPLAFIIKACCKVLREQPTFNSSLHPNGESLIVKDYINVGMAVDTEEGLVVPVIRDADQKDVWVLSGEITALAGKARDKKLGLDDLSGGTFSVSSLGALGGTGFTPIVNAPEVAILGVARLATKPLWVGDRFEPRKVLPLSLSYDHRVINGADGGRFMVRLTELLGDVRHLAL